MAEPEPSDYDRSVFINCPFDADYRRLFDAMVFAVFDCGFIPRCALESRDGGQARIEKIYGIIPECRYGIHDISRTEIDGDPPLPRFNMPLELGIFLGAKRYGNERQRKKVCLVLDRERYRYQRFCSDIAGNDIDAHKNDPQAAVTAVRDWLECGGEVSARLLPSGSELFKRYEAFLQGLPALCATPPLHLNSQELTFADYTYCCESWLQKHPRDAERPANG